MISVGIDVSKGKSMICILKPYGEVVVSPFEVEHNETDLSSLVKLLHSLTGEVRVVMEATGQYHLPILEKLKNNNIFVAVTNPLTMKKYASVSLRKGKTDKLDSVRIANYGIDNWFHLAKYKADEEKYEELKILGRQYSHYIKVQVNNKQALDVILDRTLPGLKTLLLHGPNGTLKDKLADFTEKYWHYDKITKMNENKFVDSYSKWAKKKGYRQSNAKAKAIYAMAKNAIPTLDSNTPSTKMLVLESVRIMKETSKTLSVILTRMKELAKTLKEYEILITMPGLGETLATRFLAEVGDVRRFYSGKALIAYAGIDSPPFESGNYVGQKRNISKRGSSLLRKTGYEIMKSIKVVKPTEDAAIYKFMLKKENEGKPKKVAKIAGLNKFLRIYYARVMELY